MRPFTIALVMSLAGSLAASLAACGGKPSSADKTTPPKTGDDPDDMLLGQPCAAGMLAMPETDESKFGPLEVGADYATYKKLSRAPFPSKTHGGRFVEVYVNDVGYGAYINEQDLPVGTVVVKTSWEAKDGAPSDVPGPIFVMRKEAPGYLPDHEDYYYGIHWAAPTPKQAAMLGGPIYWRGHSAKVSYCYKCHDNYDRSIGGVPTEAQNWESAAD